MIDFDKVEFEVESTPNGKFLKARLRIFDMVKINEGIDIGVLKNHLRLQMWHYIYDEPAPKPKMI